MLTAQIISATNLGGGCVPTGENGLTFVSSGVFPVVSVSHELFTGVSPMGSPYAFIFFGNSDPAVLLTSCGCVAHTSAEFFTGLSAFAYPAAASGYLITAQVVYLGAYSPAPGTVYFGPWPGPGGCTEAGLALVLSDGYRLALP